MNTKDSKIIKLNLLIIKKRTLNNKIQTRNSYTNTYIQINQKKINYNLDRKFKYSHLDNNNKYKTNKLIMMIINKFKANINKLYYNYKRNNNL